MKPQHLAYPTGIQQLLCDGRIMPIGPGNPQLEIGRKLEVLKPDALFTPLAIRDSDMANACVAALWLYHSFLDESHGISQSIHSPSGSDWHGIMHRREPDFANAKYWFRRVGNHPVLEPLYTAAKEAAERSEVHASAWFLKTQSAWDPFAFVDLCEASLAGSSPSMQLCQEVQQCEWSLLFDYCFRQ